MMMIWAAKRRAMKMRPVMISPWPKLRTRLSSQLKPPVSQKPSMSMREKMLSMMPNFSVTRT